MVFWPRYSAKIHIRRSLLEALPVELLYEVQNHALSSSLPLTSKHLYVVFKSAPSSVHAQFLLGRCLHSEHTTRRTIGFITTALKYPLCCQDVLEAIFRSPEFGELSSAEKMKSVPIELPRRLFSSLAPRPTDQGWSEDDPPLPFLRYLYDTPRIPPPIPDSYALIRAVYAGFIPLVHFLLAHDTSPAYKDGMAVLVAIRRKDLALVRMLVERDHSGRAPGTGMAKRRKLGDRVQVNAKMLKTAVQCDARDIVEYLMKEKGCIPDMQTVLLMGSR